MAGDQVPDLSLRARSWALSMALAWCFRPLALPRPPYSGHPLAPRPALIFQERGENPGDPGRQPRSSSPRRETKSRRVGGFAADFRGVCN